MVSKGVVRFSLTFSPSFKQAQLFLDGTQQKSMVGPDPVAMEFPALMILTSILICLSQNLFQQRHRNSFQVDDCPTLFCPFVWNRIDHLRIDV